MLVLHDPTTLTHQTVELLGSSLIPALESPERITSILSYLATTHHEVRTIHAPPEHSPSSPCPPATDGLDLDRLLAITHKADYLAHLRTVHASAAAAGLIDTSASLLPECFPPRDLGPSKAPSDPWARLGWFAFDMSSGIGAGTWAATRATVLGDGDEENKLSVLALTRPPGHHCTTTQAGGYCYVNNAVVAVAAVRALNGVNSQIAILDLDFHHGNGTQGVYYEDQDVMYVSLHGKDEYPYYTGAEEEEGEEPGEGMNVNIPLPVKCSAERYVEELEGGLRVIDGFQPDCLLVSLGFDTFHLDPLGGFALDTPDYKVIGQRVRRSFRGPAVLLLEGGYVLDRLGPNLGAFLEGWIVGDREIWRGGKKWRKK
ncbi:Arginase/deacetylase [Trichodelitschia bisporula]|uniref:Arginase/deacetylase n=1 Tax=Trichodelitschia bisporula TaxID=703511 RepID=A0A6G1HWJ3_9PEZI|nr:Arginase/deacetylase [Trichodelitschia bisporula]